ncbi:MAG: NAD-dependent epimerase/dehydratase family protein [Planctomycetota bacterium]|jgi:nucleoside-diphosphate-sugar epimerase
MSKRYLVTGCAGFIGARVTGLLLEGGHRVVGVDELNDAYDPRLKQWRLSTLEPHEGFRFHRLDVTDRAAMARLFEAGAPSPDAGDIEQTPYSAVINLAARAGVRPSVENPRLYFRTNCDGTLNLLELCRRFGVGKFLLASTSSLYGARKRLPYREEDDTDRPLSPYAASKKAAETLAHAYHHLHGLDVTVLRYFTVYGPAGRPDMSVFRFIRRMAEGEPIVVYGDGTQRRDFTYVDDVARGTVAALAPFGYEVINLGADRPVKISAIVAQIAELVGRRPVIRHRPAHRADVPATWADVSKARRLLGWSPEVSLQEGLTRSVQWYRDNRDVARPLDLGDG